MTHICVGINTNIGSDNGLSPGWRQAIIWSNAGILLIGPLATNFNEILTEILTFSFKKMRLKVSSAKWRPSCLGLNVLKMGRQDSNPSNDLLGDMSYHRFVMTPNIFVSANLPRKVQLYEVRVVDPWGGREVGLYGGEAWGWRSEVIGMRMRVWKQGGMGKM